MKYCKKCNKKLGLLEGNYCNECHKSLSPRKKMVEDIKLNYGRNHY